jgi:hypothetical protein
MYATGPEHRDAQEVQRIVDQLPNIKVYLGHPASYPAEKSGQKSVGYVESGRVDDDSAIARMVITDADALKAIEAGTHELSLGYSCGLDGDRYQREITLDHLAIVERARCGASCAMRVDDTEKFQETMKLDLTDAVKEALDAYMASMKMCPECGMLSGEHKDTCMSKPLNTDCTCKNHATSYTTGEQPMADENKTDLAAEMAALKTKLDEATAALTKLEIEATNARKDADAYKAKLDAAEAEVVKAKEEAAAAISKAKADADEAFASEVRTRVDARVALTVEAKPFLGETDISKMSDREIKCAVIKHIDGDDVPAEKSMDYVTGVYEGALKRANAASASRETVRTTLNTMRKDNAPANPVDAERAAKAKMNHDSAQAWTK